MRWIRFSVRESITMPASTCAWPKHTCPCPRLATLSRCVLANLIIVTTSSTDPGRSTAHGNRCTMWP
jgi:hypothetical protein